MALLSAALATAASRCRFGVVGAAKADAMDDPGHRKIHATPIPLAGGLAVMTGLVVPLLAGTAFAVASFPTCTIRGFSNTDWAARHPTPRHHGRRVRNVADRFAR